MNLEPKAQAFINTMAQANMPPLQAGTPQQARAIAAAMKPVRAPRALPSVSDHRVPTPEGGVPARLYVPDSPRDVCILYLHGGGWVIGGIEETDGFSRELAAITGCAVLSVGYRLAPEAPFPAPVEDCYAALVFLADNAPTWLGRPAAIVVLGDSAGGNLATVIANLALQRGGPPIALQILAYPVTDANLDTGTYQEFRDGPLLTRALMAWFWEHYVSDEASRADPLASPLRASLSGLPPAFVLTAENDVLRDEGEAYAAALQAAGVPTLLKRYDGQIHGFLTLVGFFDGGDTAMRDVASFIDEHLPG
jgi:acetyl esterase